MEWVDHFISLAKRLMERAHADFVKLQKEFNVNSKSILTQMMQDLRMTSKISQYFPSQEEHLSIVPG
jgi:hypothetical protein